MIDHVAEQAVGFHGVNELDRSNEMDDGKEEFRRGDLLSEPAIQPMIDTDNIDFMYEDGQTSLGVGPEPTA